MSTSACLVIFYSILKVVPYSLEQIMNDLYRPAVRPDVILKTFAWNSRGSAMILKQAAERQFMAIARSGVASSVSAGDIFIYSCSAQLTSFQIDSISKETNVPLTY